MSDLAFNLSGEPFDVPENASGWRVRRMKSKGAPEVVYGRSGQPLIVPIDADLEDVRAEVGAPGRYRFDAVDELAKPIEGAPAGYVYIHEQRNAAASANSSAVGSLSPSAIPYETILVEALRTQAAIAMAVVERFPQMIDSSASLVRAADGAGIPARAPRASEDEPEDSDDDNDDNASPPAASSSFELINTLVAQIVPIIISGMSTKKLPPLAAIVDWRKAQQPAAESTDAPAPAQHPKGSASPEEPEQSPLDPKTMAHVIAVQAALTPPEAALARQLAAELGPAEQRAWLRELAALSVPDAVAKVRSLLSSGSNEGDA